MDGTWQGHLQQGAQLSTTVSPTLLSRTVEPRPSQAAWRAGLAAGKGCDHPVARVGWLVAHMHACASVWANTCSMIQAFNPAYASLHSWPQRRVHPAAAGAAGEDPPDVRTASLRATASCARTPTPIGPTLAGDAYACKGSTHGPLWAWVWRAGSRENSDGGFLGGRQCSPYALPVACLRQPSRWDDERQVRVAPRGRCWCVGRVWPALQCRNYLWPAPLTRLLALSLPPHRPWYALLWYTSRGERVRTHGTPWLVHVRPRVVPALFLRSFAAAAHAYHRARCTPQHAQACNQKNHCPSSSTGVRLGTQPLPQPMSSWISQGRFSLLANWTWGQIDPSIQRAKWLINWHSTTPHFTDELPGPSFPLAW